MFSHTFKMSFSLILVKYLILPVLNCNEVQQLYQCKFAQLRIKKMNKNQRARKLIHSSSTRLQGIWDKLAHVAFPII